MDSTVESRRMIGAGARATVAALALCASCAAGAETQVIHAGLVLDGKGGVQRNAAIVVEDGRITRVAKAGSARPTYDFSRLTVMPGMIDTHVHLNYHFGFEGHFVPEEISAARQAHYSAENAYVTLMAGFTTVQSIGSRSDYELRIAIERGVLPGPRVLTSVVQFRERELALTPEQVRAWVKTAVEQGADVIKLFATKSIREGGGQTMSDAQIEAACGQAKALGKRSWVHAHGASAMLTAARAGCTAIAHGSQATEEVFETMAKNGVYFEPNIGLVSQNYLDHKAQYLGIGNYDEEGFRYTVEGIPVKLAMFKRALKHKDLKLIMGTDAVAGAHGRNVQETIYRVKTGGQRAMDAIVGVTSLNAEALGLADRIGSLAPGMEADLIAVDGDPLKDITALSRVVFVMRGGTVFKNVAASSAAQR